MEEKKLLNKIFDFYQKISFKMKVIMWVAIVWIISFIIYSIKYADFGGALGSTANHLLYSYLIGGTTGILIAVLTSNNKSK